MTEIELLRITLSRARDVVIDAIVSSERNGYRASELRELSANLGWFLHSPDVHLTAAKQLETTTIGGE